jgi:hypothetical protein
MRRAIIIGMALLGLVLFGCLAAPPALPKAGSSGCATKECFFTAATACRNATLRLNDSSGTVLFSTSNCTFKKTILALDPKESAQMKDLVEGTSMTCVYENGKFDTNWVNSLVLGVEKCDGTLKDALASLIVFT